MNRIRAIVVEDMPKEMENLLLKLKENCPGVEVIATCRTGETAVETIKELEPQLVFLDIELGTMSGFDVLEQLTNVSFEVIFTTGFNKYAVQAFKVNALDYLLKPLAISELTIAVKKALKKLSSTAGRKPRIAVPVKHSIRFLGYDEIMYCRADDQKTMIHLFDPQTVITVGRVLGEIAQKLPISQFFRIHRASVVNWEYVKSFEKYGGGFVVMKDGKKLSVAKTRKEELLNWLLLD